MYVLSAPWTVPWIYAAQLLIGCFITTDFTTDVLKPQIDKRQKCKAFSDVGFPHSRTAITSAHTTNRHIINPHTTTKYVCASSVWPAVITLTEKTRQAATQAAANTLLRTVG